MRDVKCCTVYTQVSIRYVHRLENVRPFFFFYIIKMGWATVE